ncbi:ABC transporter ATP-binding protein [Egicoccus sp. AB-alg2]|uniref:ABC transporter ATP-binding protein n=1 Tax=Egicoccus sp. AB-alg2 TaxID=3242693 RepID=UPI00359EBBF7
MSLAPLLIASGLGRTYRRGAEEVVALADVSFRLEPGELVVLTGPSGSGKTTLLNILAGWETPDTGQLAWGERGTTVTAPGWDLLAIAPQRLGLLPELTIGENVELPLRLAGGEDRAVRAQRLETALEAFGIAHLAHRMPSEVSLGEQQRTALARALVGVPRLLLADEPTGHQDAAWASGVMDGLRKAAAAGSAVLVATHDEEIIAQAPRRLRLRDGRLIA